MLFLEVDVRNYAVIEKRVFWETLPCDIHAEDI